MAINPNYQNLLINLRSDDPSVNPGNNDPNDTHIFFPFSRSIVVPANNFLNISVLNAEIPNSWYSWDQDQQMRPYWYGTDTLTAITDQVWTFPAKRWTPCTWLSSFNAQKAAKVAAGNFTQADADKLVITWDKTTLKWDFSGGTSLPLIFFLVWGVDVGTPSPTDSYFQVPVLPTISDARSIMAFFGFPMRRPDGNYNTGIWRPEYGDRFVFFTTLNNDGTATSLPNVPSEIVADASRFHNISITSQSLHTDSIDTIPNDISDQHVLTKIPVNAPFGSIILYTGNTLDGFLYRQQTFQYVDLALSDHNGDAVNLHGARFNITLLVAFVERINPPTPVAPLPPLPANISTAKELESSFVDSRRRRRMFRRRRRFGIS